MYCFIMFLFGFLDALLYHCVAYIFLLCSSAMNAFRQICALYKCTLSLLLLCAYVYVRKILKSGIKKSKGLVQNRKCEKVYAQIFEILH